MPCAIVSPDVEARYTEVIDLILAKSDLNTISEKRIRKGLQEVVGYDLTPQKVRNAVLDSCRKSFLSISDHPRHCRVSANARCYHRLRLSSLS